MSSGNQRYIEAAGTHDITMGDDFINVKTSVGEITLVFPNIRDSGAIPTNKVWFVNDVDDMAATNNVTIMASTTNPITELNGGSSVVLNTNGFSAEIAPSGYYSYMVNAGTGGGGMSGSGTLNYVAKWTPDGTSLGNSLLFDNGTNVGIGTADPQLKFVVNASNGQSLGVYNATAEVVSSQLYHETANGGSLRVYDDAGTIKVLIAAKTNNSYINSGKNFGVGTNSPTATEHIVGIDSTSSNYSLKVDNSASSPILYARNDKSIFIDSLSGVGIRLVASDSSGKLSSSQVTDDGTSIGIGISSGIKFNVLANTNGDWEAARFYSNNAAQYSQIGWGGMTSTYYLKFQSGSGQPLTLNASGENVGIGTSSPTSKLQVVGLSEYADNAAAITAGLTAGAFYRTGDNLKVVH